MHLIEHSEVWRIPKFKVRWKRGSGTLGRANLEIHRSYIQDDISKMIQNKERYFREVIPYIQTNETILIKLAEIPLRFPM